MIKKLIKNGFVTSILLLISISLSIIALCNHPSVKQGMQGEKGEQGNQGLQGAQGIQGEKGEKGDSYLLTDTDRDIIANLLTEMAPSANNLKGKKIIYDGDSICSGTHGGGGYAQIIADMVGGTFENHAVGGARLISLKSGETYHSIVDHLKNLPTDGDLYCFQGGINDWWTYGILGTYNYDNFDGELDTHTVCGALETIFRYAINHFQGKPICFIITHKIQETAYKKNANGNTFKEYRDAMVGICEKYSIPYYDAFSESGLNGWNDTQNALYLTGNPTETPDGCHPNEEGYKRYYVPQLISLFQKMLLPDSKNETANVLESVNYYTDHRLSSAGEIVEYEGRCTTDYIPCTVGDMIYLQNVILPNNDSDYQNRIAYYDSEFNLLQNYGLLASMSGYDIQFTNGNLTQFSISKYMGDVHYIRICCVKIDQKSIIAINTPIK